MAMVFSGYGGYDPALESEKLDRELIKRGHIGVVMDLVGQCGTITMFLDPKDRDGETVPTDEDVESEESLMKFYERWVKKYSSPRFDDIANFDSFKINALKVHSLNKEQKYVTSPIWLTYYADSGTLRILS